MSVQQDLDRAIEMAVDTAFIKYDAFTAFQITLDLQAQGFDIVHRNVKQRVHKAINDNILNNSYIKSHISKDSVSFFIYHTPNYDINTFKLSKKSSSHPKTPTYDVNKPKSQSNGELCKVSRGYRDRYLITSDIMKKVFRLKDKVYITPIGDEILLTPTPHNSTKATILRSEPSFRVSKKYVTKVYGDLPDKLSVAYKNFAGSTVIALKKD